MADGFYLNKKKLISVKLIMNCLFRTESPIYFSPTQRVGLKVDNPLSPVRAT